MFEKKQLILKLSPVDKDRGPKFPKCSHVVQNNINRPLTTAPLENDIYNYQYNSMHDISKPFLLLQDKDESLQEDIKDPQLSLELDKVESAVNNKKAYEIEQGNYVPDMSVLLNYETLTDSGTLFKPLFKKSKIARSKERLKGKHHNKFIYYTSEDESTPLVEIKSKESKTHKIPSPRTQTLHHTIKPAVTHKTFHTKTQKVHPKEKLMHSKATQKIENSQPESHWKHNEKAEHPTRTENKLHSSHNTQSKTEVKTESPTSGQDSENVLYNADAKSTDFGVDIFLSTIQPYFNELQKQITDKMELEGSETNSETSASQPLSTEGIYKLLKPKILKILKFDKAKRFITNQDDVTGESEDDEAVPTTIINEFNSSTLQ